MEENLKQYLINFLDRGEFNELLEIGSKLTKKHPDCIILMNILAAAATGLNDFTLAITYYDKALSVDPNSASTYNNRASSFKTVGNLERAIADYKKAVELKPDFIGASRNLGSTFLLAKKYSDAVTALKYVLDRQPACLKTHLLIANAYRGLNDSVSALHHLNVAYNIDDENEQVLEQFGDLNVDIGEYDKAIVYYEKIVAQKNVNADILSKLAIAYQKNKRFFDALNCYDTVLLKFPETFQIHNNKGNCLSEMGKLGAAAAAFENAISLSKTASEPHNGLGLVYTKQASFSQAIDSFKTAISLNPSRAEYFNNLGNALLAIGDIGAAKENYQKSLEIDPLLTMAHLHLSSLITYDSQNPHFKQMLNLIQSTTFTLENKVELCFALAKAFSDQQDYKSSFQYYAEANKGRKKYFNYNIQRDVEFFQKLKEFEQLLEHSPLSDCLTSNEITPIFVIGMPRSGTSLVERVLSNHSQVVGCGELPHFLEFGLSSIYQAIEANTENLNKFRKHYLEIISSKADGCEYAIDKTPHNFQFVPLIIKLFPNAKILRTVRDPEATCWSNFKQYFPSAYLQYCYDLSDCANYYALYEELMQHWYSSYPGKIIDCNYELLTANPDTYIYELLKSIDLPFQESCLHPEKNLTAITTASQSQVRRKIYSNSSKSWRYYEEYIDNAFDILKPQRTG